MIRDATRAALLDAVEAGPLAADRLATLSTGFIAARFAASCYADVGDRLLCLGGPDLPNGPINVRTAALPAGLLIGDAVTIESSRLTVWQPPNPVSRSRHSVAPGLHALRDFVSGTTMETGLTGLVFGQKMPFLLPAFADRAQAGIGDLRLWLAASDDGADALERGIGTLLGLGPGLTPSGDDFLVGMLVALCETQEAGLQARLSETIRHLAPARTAPISTAHLLAACDGMASDALHRALQAILCNRPSLADDLAALAVVGHSSGWDALAGAVTVMEGASGAPARALPPNPSPPGSSATHSAASPASRYG